MDIDMKSEYNPQLDYIADCTGEPQEEVIGTCLEDENPQMQTPARAEGTHKVDINRLQKIAELARLLGWKRMGIAFCEYLYDEVRAISSFFENEGFEVFSLCCNNCGKSKREFDPDQVIHDPKSMAMCNPKYKDIFISEHEADVYISLGLGWDTNATVMEL